MFDAFDPAVHIIEPPHYAEYQFRLGGDWGTAAPSTAILLGCQSALNIDPLSASNIDPLLWWGGGCLCSP